MSKARQSVQRANASPDAMKAQSESGRGTAAAARGTGTDKAMTKAKRAAKEPRPYHRGNAAADLRAAAVHVLKTERYEDLSVRRLTREIGVTPANFYNHYENLEALLLDIAADAHLERAEYTRKLIARSASRVEAAKAAAVNFIEFAVANPEVFRIMFGLPGRIGHPGYIKASDESFGMLVQMIYGEDLYDPANLNGTHERCQTAYAYFALIYGFARIVLEQNIAFKSKAESRGFIESLVQSFVDGSAGLDLTRPVPTPIKARRAG